MDSKFTYLKSINAEYIEDLYQNYLADPDSVDESWKYFFEGIELGEQTVTTHTNGTNGKSNGNGASTSATPVSGTPNVTAVSQGVSSEAKVGSLIQTYRRSGILAADINPLEPANPNPTELDIKTFELTEADLDRTFTAAKIIKMQGPAKLRDIIAHLKKTYSRTIGVEWSHVFNLEYRNWLEENMEVTGNTPNYSKEEKIRILQKLTEAETFERFLHTRYVAQKRFSVEGADTLIPMLDCLVNEAAGLGATDVVMGMAHRGRLNVLTNIYGKKYEDIFSEFEGSLDLENPSGEGDVKYHGGFSADIVTPQNKKIHLSLAANPSHLEFVNPVVEGVTRSKQNQKHDLDRKKVIPVLIHGDAAFAGQGIVYETIQLSLLNGYNTGGTIHIITNNQIGFTANPDDSRSTKYASDVAKMLEAPVFHVNGDDAEAANYVMQLAVQFREKFNRDVVIDQICYRKYGHNEGDEPNFTQPELYKKIKKHPSPREIYAKKLIAEGVVTEAEAQDLVKKMNETLIASQQQAKSTTKPPFVSVFKDAWSGFRKATPKDFVKSIDTSVKESVLKEVGKKLVTVPDDFSPHPKLKRLLEQRAKQIEEGKGIDWGTGEALAFGTLVNEKSHVRVSGQDSERGTFSHRHAVLHDPNNNKSYVPLKNISKDQAGFSIYNSPLSEAAVLGFEYGYSMADPKSLVIWEAQFGDFANGAQVIIDQFIASTESKWQRMIGLVMLLPHGYEGQGPEHSSARLERFLQLCAKENIQVANLTTPAQIFHALRRQIRREFRKPLVVMSPKSLLRHPKAISSIDEFSKGRFQETIDDPISPKKARRLIVCTGKVYYDLVEARDQKKIDDIAIVRVEQLYPWPQEQMSAIIKKYSSAKEIFWVQEEPRNMGAWSFVRDYLSENLGPKQKLSYLGRSAAAAPAVGYNKLHVKEQKAILTEALK